jgi:hypothetical protein
MADDKSIRDNRDRSKVSAHQEYEINYLMTKYDISRNKVMELIAKHAGNRKNIERELNSIDL